MGFLSLGEGGAGGVFIVLSLLWGWKIDGVSPDTPDVSGGLIALAGVFAIM
jgi:small multidrug resistance family-3 protein